MWHCTGLDFSSSRKSSDFRNTEETNTEETQASAVTSAAQKALTDKAGAVGAKSGEEKVTKYRNNFFTTNWSFDSKENTLSKILKHTIHSIFLRVVHHLVTSFSNAGITQKVEMELASEIPDAKIVGDDPVYDTYLADRNKLIADCTSIVNKYGNSLPPHVVDDYTSIQNGVGLLDQAYRDNGSSLKEFNKAANPVMVSAAAAFADAMGTGGSNHDKIEYDLEQATNLQEKIGTGISSAAGQLSTTGKTMGTLQSQLESLETEINKHKDGPKKTKALAALKKAQASYFTLELCDGSATTTLANLQKAQGKLSLQDLKSLAGKGKPSDDDVTQADKDLVPFTSLDTLVSNFNSETLDNLSDDVSTVQSAISAVNQILHPSPKPKPGSPQHGLWWVDWETQPTTPFKFDTEYLGQPISFINFFVGRMDDGNGNFALPNGFGNYTTKDLSGYAKTLKANGISPGFSIGGGGGSYDHTWKVLLNGDKTPEEIGQAIAQFCVDNGFDRFDVDFEADFSPELDAAVGQMILAFKQAQPDLQISLCTYAGFGSGLPWEADLKYLFDASKDASGKSVIDMVNIMSYTNPLEDEENWIGQWATWLTENYGMDKAQISCGIDDSDAHDYDPKAFMDWAVEEGYSTCHWAENLPGPDGTVRPSPRRRPQRESDRKHLGGGVFASVV